MFIYIGSSPAGAPFDALWCDCYPYYCDVISFGYRVPSSATADGGGGREWRLLSLLLHLLKRVFLCEDNLYNSISQTTIEYLVETSCWRGSCKTRKISHRHEDFFYTNLHNYTLFGPACACHIAKKKFIEQTIWNDMLC